MKMKLGRYNLHRYAQSLSDVWPFLFSVCQSSLGSWQILDFSCSPSSRMCKPASFAVGGCTVNGEKWRALFDLLLGGRGNSVDHSGKPVLTLLPLLQNQFFSDPRLCNVTTTALVNVCPASQSCFWGTKLPLAKKKIRENTACYWWPMSKAVVSFFPRWEKSSKERERMREAGQVKRNAEHWLWFK